MSELSIHELEAQHGEVLPEREALSHFTLGSYNTHVNAINHVNASNHATVNQLGGFGADQVGSASANQSITIVN